MDCEIGINTHNGLYRPSNRRIDDEDRQFRCPGRVRDVTLLLIRLLPGLSCTTVGRPVRFSMAMAPAMSVTRWVMRRFFESAYSQDIQASWVMPAVAAASRDRAVVTLPSRGQRGLAHIGSPHTATGCTHWREHCARWPLGG
jgi:hypothetical protein